MHDKNGVQIEAGNTLFNPYDRDKYHTVLQDADGRLYLGDFDSPLERYAPQIWWEVVAEEIFPGTRAALMSLGHNAKVSGRPHHETEKE